MSIDPWREVRDAVRPSAHAGLLSDARATQIAARHRVDVADVRRIYDEEHTRLHPTTADPDSAVQGSAPLAGPAVEQTPPADTDPSPELPAATGGHEAPVPADEPPVTTAPSGTADIPPPGPDRARDVDELSPREQEQASEMALVSDAVLALVLLAEHELPTALVPFVDRATEAVRDLHAALQDHHRNAALVAELAIVEARAAEIRQALGIDAEVTDGLLDTVDRVASGDRRPRPQPEVGGGRADCPVCGKEFYVNGMPRHMATHKKRGAA